MLAQRTLLHGQATATIPEVVPVTPSPSSPSLGSFFEQRTIPIAPVIALESQPAVVIVETVAPISSQISAETEPAQPPVSPWTSDALARFKKMPDFSKHRSS